MNRIASHDRRFTRWASASDRGFTTPAHVTSTDLAQPVWPRKLAVCSIGLFATFATIWFTVIWLLTCVDDVTNPDRARYKELEVFRHANSGCQCVRRLLTINMATLQCLHILNYNRSKLLDQFIRKIESQSSNIQYKICENIFNYRRCQLAYMKSSINDRPNYVQHTMLRKNLQKQIESLFYPTMAKWAEVHFLKLFKVI